VRGTLAVIVVLAQAALLPASARAGTVGVGGERRRLFPRGGERALSPGEFYAFKLRPAPGVARQIARALTNGKHPARRVHVALTNQAGVVQSPHYLVELTKFRR
jgi:hypothetical protein